MSNVEHDTAPRFIRMGEVLQRTGKTRALMYEEIAKGEFPAPVPISARAVAWIESEVLEWQQRCIREREKPTKARSLPNPTRRPDKPKRTPLQRRGGGDHARR